MIKRNLLIIHLGIPTLDRMHVLVGQSYLVVHCYVVVVVVLVMAGKMVIEGAVVGRKATKINCLMNQFGKYHGQPMQSFVKQCNGTCLCTLYHYVHKVHCTFQGVLGF